jgi:hypothetical protein
MKIIYNETKTKGALGKPAPAIDQQEQNEIIMTMNVHIVSPIEDFGV